MPTLLRRRAVAALAALGALPILSAQQPPAPVRVAAVERAMTAERRQVTGNLRAASRAEVAAIEPGRITAVEVREADVVEAGQVLARIDDRLLQQDLVGARAELATAEAELEIRRTEVAAADEDLAAYEQAAQNVAGSVSALTLRAARRDAVVARARVLVAERALARLASRIERFAIRLEDTQIRAPFAGRVVAVGVEPGEWADPGSVVCTLVSKGEIEAWIEVPEQFDYAALAAHADLSVKVETLGVVIDATASRVIPDVDPRSRRFVLIAVLPDGDHPLAPGMSVTAALPTGEQAELVRMPSDALLSDGGGHFVYRVLERPQQGAVAAPVSVRLRFSDGKSIWVESDELESGDRVVVEGNERLRPMAPVQVLGPRPDGAGPAGGSGR
jgi:RND family efflux transporter MFP subunit